MAVIRQNLELLSPDEGDTDGARQNKITFYGFKDGENDFNDVTNGIGPTSQVTGTGLNDATFGGTYTGGSTNNYRVKVTATGTPDSFQYSDDGGSSYNGSDIEMRSDGPQNLNEGVTILWGATTGHTLNDAWQSTVIVPLTTLSTPHKMAEIEVNHSGSSADIKGRLIFRTNDGGDISAVSMHTSVGSPATSDFAVSGTYTGGPSPVTYYVKTTNVSTTPHKWAWSNNNNNYSSDFDMSASALDIELGIQITWTGTTAGDSVGDIYKFSVGQDNLQLYANGDFVLMTGNKIVSEGDTYVPKIFDVSGTQLNSYS